MTWEQREVSAPFVVERDGHVVVAAGELDVTVVEELRAALTAAREWPRRPVVLDLSGVLYLDSAVVSVLFEHADQLQLRLPARSPLNKVLSLSGVLSLPGITVAYPVADVPDA